MYFFPLVKRAEREAEGPMIGVAGDDARFAFPPSRNFTPPGAALFEKPR
jgi:hypothetical protein